MPACPHCGHETDASARECPLCGTPLSDRDGEPTAATAGAGQTPADREPVPWEDPELGFAAGIGRTWRESMFEPSRFFGRIRDEGTVVRALLYYLLVTVVGSFFTLLWDAGGVSLAHFAGAVEAGGSAATGPVVNFVLSPFLALFTLLMVTAVYHLGAVMVASDRRGMGATARVVCYASSPALLAVVPVVGALVGAIWSLVLQVVGLREAHRTTTPRALFMIFWLWVAFVVLGVVAAFLAVALGAGGDGALALAEVLGTG